MRKQVKMAMSLNDEVTITFYHNNNVAITHSDVRGTSKHEFDVFDDGVEFFRRMIGALYLDGYR